MKLKVPFVRNLKKWKGNGWCGPLALASILRYHHISTSVEDIARLAGTNPKTGGTPPNGLINFCLSQNMKVIHISKHEIMANNREVYSQRLKEFYKRVRRETNDSKFYKLNSNSDDFSFVKKASSIKEIESFLKQGKPVLAMINLAEFYKKDALWPHYVAVVGYDKQNLYVHNVAPTNKAFEKVKKDVFMKARTSEGLDMNVIVPYK